MQIKLINCDTNLKTNFGIDMQAIGSYDRLVIELNNRLLCWAIEYDFIEDSIKFDVEDGTVIPDLSAFGEVQPYDSTSW